MLLVVVGAFGGSKKKKKKGRSAKGAKKRNPLKEYEESAKQNQRIIEQAYRQFDRLSAEEIRSLGKQLGKDLIGEPPTEDRETLRQLASAKRLDSATTMRRIVAIRGDLDLDRGFLDMLDSRLVPRIESLLSERWNKLEARASRNITEKVWDAWVKYSEELDEICQDQLWSAYGPIPECLRTWNERVRVRAEEIEEQLEE